MKSHIQDTVAEPKTLSVTNEVINSYLATLDFTKPGGIPSTSVIVRSLTKAMSDKQRQVIALELFPGAFRDRINERLKKMQDEAAEKIKAAIKEEFNGSGLAEALPVQCKLTQTYLLPQIDQDDLEGLDDEEKKSILFRDSMGMLYICAARAALRDQRSKLELNITRCRSGLEIVTTWESVLDVMKVPEPLSLLDWWRQATPAQRKRAVTLLVGSPRAESTKPNAPRR